MTAHDFGMIVRADHGGIAAQTLEIARQCRPRRALVVDLGAGGRGLSDPSLFTFIDELQVTSGYPTRWEMEWLAAAGTVFSVEGIYGEDSRAVLEHTGTRLVLQANPELYVPDDLRGVNLHVVAPTAWRLDVLPDDTEILPVPIDTVALRPEPRAPGPLRIGHMTGAAMLDRNGTLVLYRALRLAPELEVEVLLANQQVTSRTRRDGRISRWPESRTYLERWAQPRPDLLVQPRRYGGLCLPAQEAAGCGIPTLMPAVSPQMEWPLPLFDAHEGRTFPMKGGTFQVHDPDADALAGALRSFCDGPAGANLERYSALARAWAEELAWDRWRDRYLKVLCG